MKIFDYFDKLILFDRLVSEGKTGTPQQFATRLGISRTTLYEVIAELQSRNIEISYSRNRNTFFYKGDMAIEIRFMIKELDELDNDEKKRTNAGSNLVPFFFPDGSGLYL